MSDSTKNPEPSADDPAFLRADIEVTRQELADSVSELAHKLNVPERARKGADHLELVVGDKLPSPANYWVGGVFATIRRRPAVAAAVVVGLLIGLRALRQRR